MNPIVDKCDYVVYLKSNGVDNENRVIKSSAYLAETKEFFARARIEYTPTYIKEFTMENLTAAIQEGINKKRELENATVTSFEEQQKLNTVKELNFNELVNTFTDLVSNIKGSDDINCHTEEGIKFKNYWTPKITQIMEKYLGKGGKVSQCNENQVEALDLIVSDLKELLKSAD